MKVQNIRFGYKTHLHWIGAFFTPAIVTNPMIGMPNPMIGMPNPIIPNPIIGMPNPMMAYPVIR